MGSDPIVSAQDAHTAGQLFGFRFLGLVEQVDETVHGLGVLDLVREVAVDAARVLEVIRSTGVLDAAAVTHEELERYVVSLAALNGMRADRAEGPVRAVLGVPE